ncbi:restriction endonuclease subunit S [Faecalibaculum rodentium]|nr:restriction endonuclease subunit S [Faecalibaculum rodentium]
MGTILTGLQNNTLSRTELSFENGSAMNIHYGDILVKFDEILDIKKENLPLIEDVKVISKFKNSFLQNGDIVIADTAEDETVGKCSEIAGVTQEKVISGLHTIPYRPKCKFGPGYLGFYLNSESYHKQLLPLMQGIKVTSVSKSSMQDTVIKYPRQQEEQTLIGAFFSQIDNFITLHQRKSVTIKKLKSGLLRKMILTVESTLTDVFLPLFTIDWEQRKLGDYIHERRERTIFEDEDRLISCAINGIFLNSELFSHFRGKSNIGYLKIKKNDLILSAQNLHLGNANVNLRFQHGIISPAYKVYSLVDVNPEFMQTWVKREETKSLFLKATTEGASQCRKNIDWDRLYKQLVLFPGVSEQSQIGSFFSQLDDLITLHQRKLFIIAYIK